MIASNWQSDKRANSEEYEEMDAQFSVKYLTVLVKVVLMVMVMIYMFLFSL